MDRAPRDSIRRQAAMLGLAGAAPRVVMRKTAMNGALIKQQWQHLIPHRGSMSLLDEVIAWDDDAIHLGARSHASADNPLRSDGMLRALHLCEYGAQAMAVHGGLLAQRAGSVAAPGLLVSLRAVQLHVQRIDDLPGTIDVHAQKLLGGESSWQYQFRIEYRGRVLALGRAAVINAAHAGV